jgi:hypothetical protein
MLQSFNKGFQISFPNDLTISVMFGEGNYCQNRDKRDTPETVKSENAEFMIWHTSDAYDVYNDRLGGENGWKSPVEIAAIIQMVSVHSGTDDELRMKIRKSLV